MKYTAIIILLALLVLIFAVTAFLRPPGEVQSIFHRQDTVSEDVPRNTEVMVYFGNSTLSAGSMDCSAVYGVRRTVPLAQEVAREALDQLLSGNTEEERLVGYFSSIPEGVAIKSLVIDSGIATVRFAKGFDKDVAGSCRVAAIRGQIEETLKQFPTIDQVIIEVEGKPTDEVLQP